jgi:hypothetical protein
VRATVRAAIDEGVEFLTLFAFSSENWRRPQVEVSILMDLFARALEQEVVKLHRNDIRFKVVGDTSRFDPRIRELVAAGEALTASNTRLTLTVAANYGGLWDIVQAAATTGANPLASASARSAAPATKTSTVNAMTAPPRSSISRAHSCAAIDTMTSITTANPAAGRRKSAARIAATSTTPVPMRSARFEATNGRLARAVR